MNNLSIIDNAIEQSSEQFVSTISQYKWDLIPESQLHAAKKALTKSDFIMKIAAQNPESVCDALIQSAILGIDLSEGKRQGWLLPRKGQNNRQAIQLQVGYKGVEAIHQRMGVIDRLVIRVVRENDKFDWSGDDQIKPVHNADWFKGEKDRGPITGAYAITYYPDKTINVTVTAVSHIFEKHRDRSESYKSYITKKNAGSAAYPPPWVTDEQSMIEKTMAYIAAKQWPANIRDSERSSKILETLHETDISDYTYGVSKSQQDAFNLLIKENDALGIYLFSRRVGIEVDIILFKGLKSAAPKGTKMAVAKTHNEFVTTGNNIFNNMVNAITNEDIGLLNECIEDVTNITAKLINWVLDDEQVKIYNSMLESVK